MAFIQEGLSRVPGSGSALEDAAAEMVAEYREIKKRIPGIGHRIHSADPRTAKLFSLAQDAGISSDGVRFFTAVEMTLNKLGKQLPINVDGAIAAILVDLRVPIELANEKLTSSLTKQAKAISVGHRAMCTRP